MIIEGLHHHHDLDQFAHYKNKIDKSQEITHLDAVKISCKLCEVIKQQSHFYHLPATVCEHVFLEKSNENTIVHVPQHPVGYVHAAANKGPPVITA